MPTSEHINRLNAARLAWDVLGSANVLIARTDSESGKLISSNIDVRDHEFIKGALNLPEGAKSLAETLQDAETAGKRGKEVDDVEKAWMDTCKLVTFNEGELNLKVCLKTRLTLSHQLLPSTMPRTRRVSRSTRSASLAASPTPSLAPSAPTSLAQRVSPRGIGRSRGPRRATSTLRVVSTRPSSESTSLRHTPTCSGSRPRRPTSRRPVALQRGSTRCTLTRCSSTISAPASTGPPMALMVSFSSTITF